MLPLSFLGSGNGAVAVAMDGIVGEFSLGMGWSKQRNKSLRLDG